MNEGNKIGLITYHAAYNYGSVLQAFATQEIINKLGYDCTIINYRITSQKDYYSLIRTKYGIKTFVSDIALTPMVHNRLIAKGKFESFIQKKFKLTKEFSEPSDFKSIAEDFSCIISGSDQIWNKGSCELEKVPWTYMNPYLLKDYSGVRISYASSIPKGSHDNIKYVCDRIRDFKAISCREESISKVLSSELNKKIKTVVDPTFLLESDDWVKKLQLKNMKSNYILIYSLAGLRKREAIKNYVNELFKKFGIKVYIVCPYAYIGSNQHYKQISDIGPTDFLQLIYDAALVITDSYHGTVLSINLNVPFYSINGFSPSDSRKTEVLERFKLNDRNINWDVSNIDKMSLKCDFDYSNRMVDHEREESLKYLEMNLLM